MRHRPSPLRHPVRAVLLLLFAACNSFACSVQIFFLQFLSCLQRAGVSFAACNSLLVVRSFLGSFLFAVCNSFACSVHIFLQFPFCLQCAGVEFFDVFFMFARNSCSIFSLLKRCPLWATVASSPYPKPNTLRGENILSLPRLELKFKRSFAYR